MHIVACDRATLTGPGHMPEVDTELVREMADRGSGLYVRNGEGCLHLTAHRQWRRRSLLGPTQRGDTGKKSPHREPGGSRGHDQLLDHAVVPALHLEGGLVRLHLGDDLTFAHFVARGHQPCDQLGPVHVRPERGKQEVDHEPTTSRAAATIAGTCGRAASSMCFA